MASANCCKHKATSIPNTSLSRHIGEHFPGWDRITQAALPSVRARFQAGPLTAGSAVTERRNGRIGTHCERI